MGRREQSNAKNVVKWSMASGDWFLKSDRTVWTHVAGEWRYVRRLPAQQTVAQFAREIMADPNIRNVVFLMPQLTSFPTIGQDASALVTYQDRIVSVVLSLFEEYSAQNAEITRTVR